MKNNKEHLPSYILQYKKKTPLFDQFYKRSIRSTDLIHLSLRIFIYISLRYLFQGTEMFSFAHNRNIHLLKFLNLLFINIKYHLYFVYF